MDVMEKVERQIVVSHIGGLSVFFLPNQEKGSRSDGLINDY